jgi:hypothetical protein
VLAASDDNVSLVVEPSPYIHLFVMRQGEEGVAYDGPYLPLWQIQPTIFLNLNIRTMPHQPSQERKAVDFVYCRTKTHIFSSVSFGQYYHQS